MTSIKDLMTLAHGEEFADELCHFGIKGMKWGVRRYQNADGSLTEAGKKHYGRMTEKQLKKALNKQIRKRRKKLHGWSNQWMGGLYIGDSSKAFLDKQRELSKAYYNSPEYKKWSNEYTNKVRKVDSLYENGKISVEEYDKRYNQINKAMQSKKPKKSFNDREWAYVVGEGYKGDYVNKGGRDLSLAYLQDLGYNKQVAEQFIKKLAKKKETIGV